ncbi:7tm 7 domain containing protein [Asbolus verrucosus]|uniref:Gustatory receptor n=1 Tax=Asbolus verrucosus TaxID=1661398 RepID=A0A482VH49_ASBVE|nr:7tm 7 domain containing protein [Asbolus verrucosus]
MASAMETISKNFYKDLIYVQVAVYVLQDVNLILFNFNTVLSLFCYKKNQWRKIMQNMRIVVSAVDKVKISRAVTVVLILHVFGVAIIFSSICLRGTVGGVEYFKQYNVRYFQHYLMLFYSTLLYLVSNLLVLSYKHLNDFLRQSVTGKKILLSVNKIESSVYLLKDTIDLFNDIFGWPILQIISYTIFYTIGQIDKIFIANSLQNTYFFRRVVADVISLFLVFMETALPVMMCDLVLQAFENFLSGAHKLRRDTHVTSKEKKELSRFIKLVSENAPKFTAARFFDITRTTLLNVLGTITTFLIVLIQFRGL